MGTQVSAPAPRAPHEQSQRKQQVLTRRTPSVARGIADAVVLKDDDLFFLSCPDGQVPAGRDHGYGLYYHDCRFLDGYELRIGQVRPEALGCVAGSGGRATVQLTTGDLGGEDQGVGKEQLGVTWERSLDGQALTLVDRITMTNWGRDPAATTVELRFWAGFQDVFQVRGLLCEQFGTPVAPEWRAGALRFGYHGADELDRSVTIRFSERVERVDDTGATMRLELRPREQRTLTVTIELAETPRSGGSSPPAARRIPQDAGGGHAQVGSDNVSLNRVLERSFRDLALLRTEIDGEEFFAAGVPWFVTLFGRDSLISALQIMAYDPTVAASTLRLLARYQGSRVDQWRDEEPGKILHELRVGELARLGEIPHTPYYGSVDATPLFLMVLERHAAWTGDLTLFRELRGNVERALEWIDRSEGAAGGYLQYHSSSDHGLINQGWKDSGNAIVDRHGHLATPPIALVEVQAYVYQAKLAVADLCHRSGDEGRAATLRQEASALRDRFNRDFWRDRLGCYALALEDGGRPLDVVSSNAGHALWGGIAEPDKARRTVERLMQPDMFSGWGVRTLSADQPSYNPIGYHLGTVWPHDNSIVAVGCRRYGLDVPAHRIFEGITAAASQFSHDRLPELFTGFTCEEYGEPIRYPVACHPQAWAAGSVPYLLEALLGLEPDGFARRLRVVRPSLPDFVDWLELRDLRVGSGRVDLRFRRMPDATAVERIGSDGDVDLVVER